MILGLDIGGANTKAASSDGLFAESVYLPLWKHAPLDEVLGRFAKLEPQAVAVVITGELADCFSTKREGTLSLTAAVKLAFSCPNLFLGHERLCLDRPNGSGSSQLGSFRGLAGA